MQLPQIVEQNGARVLTTRQLTEWYKTEEWQIKQNFRNNKERFVLGKHYITLQGEELKRFKSKVENIYLVGKTAKILYLWTEKGALLHAKSLNTDKAWEVYDYLVDFYFRVKEEPVVKEPKPEPAKRQPAMMAVVDAPENPKILNAMEKIQEDLICMKVLINDCKLYLSEETYKERRKAAADVVHILVGDLTKWLDIKPNLIQKHY
jgi:hypothetical protein|nr:MAG TPA: hypothetical protein [Caudoviricetes sp.]